MYAFSINTHIIVCIIIKILYFNQLTSKTYRFVIKINGFVIINFIIKRDMRQNRFIYLFEKIDSCSLYILRPGVELGAKLYKIGSRIPFTIDPCIQSHFKWTLSLPVMLIGLLL